MQIRQKLPGQTGYDPTFPLLPESVGAQIPYAAFEMYIPLMTGVREARN